MIPEEHEYWADYLPGHIPDSFVGQPEPGSCLTLDCGRDMFPDSDGTSLSCLPLQSIGTSCTRHGQCASNVCLAGRCCAADVDPTACSACQAPTRGSTNGSCTSKSGINNSLLVLMQNCGRTVRIVDTAVMVVSTRPNFSPVHRTHCVVTLENPGGRVRVSVTTAYPAPLLPETDSVSTYDMNIYGRLGVFDGTSVDPAKELKTYKITPALFGEPAFTVTSNSSYTTLDLYSGHFKIYGPSSSLNLNQVHISMVATVEGS